MSLRKESKRFFQTGRQNLDAAFQPMECLDPIHHLATFGDSDLEPGVVGVVQLDPNRNCVIVDLAKPQGL